VEITLDVVAIIAVLTLATAVFCMVGCGGLQRDELVKAPDAPMLIVKAKGTARVAVYDATENTMVDAGTVDLGTLQGWTVSKYEWEALMQRRKAQSTEHK